MPWYRFRTLVVGWNAILVSGYQAITPCVVECSDVNICLVWMKLGVVLIGVPSSSTYLSIFLECKTSTVACRCLFNDNLATKCQLCDPI